ncbi:ABC transporter permease [Sunxiuqinia sp. A32]|uniref:ABC transporter permease n=1 Tax=Sunxiuqinia sp. A32 TaxID=3461496 RepID=UPI0040467F1E
MLQIKNILRNLKKNKAFTFINIGGLSIGIAAFFLLMIYVAFEKSYDEFLDNNENTYRVQLKQYKNGEPLFNKATSTYNIGPLIKDEIPEVKEFARAGFEKCLVFRENNYLNSQDLFWTDSTFLNVVKVEMVQGDKQTALISPYTTVLSDKLAKIYFGDSDPIGQIIYINEHLPFTVTGVFKSLPANSHLNFKLLLSLSTGNVLWPGWGTDNYSWGGHGWLYTYITLQEGSSPKVVEDKIAKLVKEKMPENFLAENIQFEFHLQKVTDIHLNSKLENEFKVNGSKQYINIFMLIGIIALIIAWINFINISNAQAYDKVKESAIRKVNGATRKDITSIFITEAFILNLLGTVIACILILISIPVFSQLTGKALDVFLKQNPSYIFMLLGTMIIGAIISGIYPGLILSSIKPEKVLKSNHVNPKSKLSFRHALVVFQLAASICLIITVTTIYKQMQYISKKDLGYNRNFVVVLEAPRSMNMDSTKYVKYRTFKENFTQISAVRNITSTLFKMGEESVYDFSVNRINGEETKDILIKRNLIDDDYLNVFGIHLLAGENFRSNTRRRSEEIIINQQACELLGFKSPADAIGKSISSNGNNRAKIIGVTANFHQENLKVPVRAMCFSFDHPNNFGSYIVSVNPSDINGTISQIETIWNEIYVNDPFIYQFLDEQLENLYFSEIRLGKLLMIFACITVFITCLGLLGLILITTKKNIKIIGIRKVNGANSIEIINLLNKDFVKWVVIAFIIAIPVSWYAMTQWLASFAYRTTLSWWIFTMAGLVIFGIAMLTVSWQSWKAASRNPVEALKYE